jgi:hypothetical protein
MSKNSGEFAMITCSYCGTSYPTFQSNCTNCGGLLSPPADNAASFSLDATLAEPPPTPRNEPHHFIWRIMLTEGWSIVAMVFLILGVTFTLVGAGLTLAIVTAFVGLPFLGFGILFLIASLPILLWRYHKAKQKLHVFQMGQHILGEITDVHQNFTVRVMGRHPWVIHYRFQTSGRDYEGQVTTLNREVAKYHPKQPVYVLYLSDNPQQNTTYPSLYT